MNVAPRWSQATCHSMNGLLYSARNGSKKTARGRAQADRDTRWAIEIETEEVGILVQQILEICIADLVDRQRRDAIMARSPIGVQADVTSLSSCQHSRRPADRSATRTQSRSRKLLVRQVRRRQPS